MKTKHHYLGIIAIALAHRVRARKESATSHTMEDFVE